MDELRDVGWVVVCIALAFWVGLLHSTFYSLEKESEFQERAERCKLRLMNRIHDTQKVLTTVSLKFHLDSMRPLGLANLA